MITNKVTQVGDMLVITQISQIVGPLPVWQTRVLGGSLNGYSQTYVAEALAWVGHDGVVALAQAQTSPVTPMFAPPPVVIEEPVPQTSPFVGLPVLQPPPPEGSPGTAP